MSSKPAYRPDIDGLRAVAVLAVIAYHFGLPLPGGFVGVDVFFVISGFVITKSILSHLEDGSFSLIGFYDRRVRRILPGLLAMTIASLLAGWVLLMPLDFVALGYQATTAVFGVSNFYFLMNSGYFDPAADMFPLLHTWSLAVEEQFYLVWPILFMTAWKVGARSVSLVVGLLIAVLVISFLGSILTVENNQPFAFYMLPSRAWEIALGALLVFVPTIGHRLAGEIIALAGLALIIYSCFALSANDSFPGWGAVAPCLGSALVIWPKTSPAIDKSLGGLPMRTVGLLSYSLYLWHWPVLVFFRHFNQGEMPGFWEALVLAALTAALSTLSYIAIERPLRTRIVPERPTVMAGVAAMLVAATFSVLPVVAGGVESRLSAEARELAAYVGYRQQDVPGVCVITVRTMPRGSPAPNCLNDRTETPRVLLIGDSHAGHIARALSEQILPAHLTLVTSSGCRPVHPTKGDPECSDLIDRAYAEIIPQGQFDAVILVARWRNGQSDMLPASIEAIAPYAPHIYVIGPIAEYPDDLPSLLVGSSALPRAKRDVWALANYDQTQALENQIRESLGNGRAEYISALQAQCPSGKCTMLLEGVPLQYDYSHFTSEGAQYVVSRLIAGGLLASIR